MRKIDNRSHRDVLREKTLSRHRRESRCHPPSPSRSAVSVQIHEADEIETQNLKMLNPQQDSQLIAEFVPFSSDKRYATTQVKAPPQLQKTGAVRMLTVSHGFVYEPYALHEKILWCGLQVCCFCRCLYMTYGSLRSLYSTHELAGVSVAILNFLQRI
ncbi:unnamed protein product [Brassica oleracea]